MKGESSKLRSDLFFIGILFAISYVAVYLLPNFARTLIFSLFAVLFIRSKDNLPWLVFFFLFFSAPASLFYSSDNWFIFLTPTVGVPYSFIIALCFVIKGIKRRKAIRYRFSLERNLFIFMILFLFVVGYVQGGISFRNLFLIGKDFPNLALILFLPVLIDLKKESLRLKKLLYIFTIVLFFIQLYEVLFGTSFFSHGSILISNEDESLQRNITGSYFVLFTLIIALSDLLARKTKRHSLELVAIVSSILILMNSGTRGWMLATGLIVFGFMFTGNKLKVSIIGLFGVIFVSVMLFFGSSKYVNNLVGSFERLSTVVQIAQGDKAAGGPRLTERGPRVMRMFKQSPILGFGISDVTVEYYDGHVANQSIMLISGIFGIIVLYFILGSIFFKVLIFSFSLDNANVVKFRLMGMLIGFLGFLVIHNTSQQMFSYFDRADKIMLLAFWFLFTLYYIDEAKSYERKLQSRNNNN